ncbi:MAG: DUF1501 domain-containing protein [Planctomycetaceae bacterium]
MLRIMGRGIQACDGIRRREMLRVGGLSLFGGLSLPQLLAARRANASGVIGPGRTKSVVLLNLFGGPPHLDMFDLKPQAPANVRGEFTPIATAVPGVQIGELLPQVAGILDRATLIRTYSHGYNSHNPYNVLTGFDGGNDRENYFAKRTDHPGIGAVCGHFGLRRHDLPSYVIMPAFPGYSQALRRAGPYGGYLGSRHDPLFTVCDPQFERKSTGDYDAVIAGGEPVLPSLGQLPDVTVDRLDRRQSLLSQVEESVASLESSRIVSGMSEFQQQAFAVLTGPRTRAAFDLAQEPASLRDRYGRNLWGSSVLIARRLVESGATFIAVHWEATHGNHWDLHENNFGMLRAQVPVLDQVVAALVTDLEQRGLLESTLVIVMGEMGRSPKINAKSGRDHWPQCGFALLFGGGMRRGAVVGATDDIAAYPADRPVSAGDLVATIYQSLGVDPHSLVHDLSGRPVPISHGGSPVWEAIA